MRHRKSGLKLNRNSSNRKALFRNLAIALIEHNIIKTTLPRAKELRRFVEPLITLSKTDSVANRRLAFSRLNNKQSVGQLFGDIAQKSKNRPGGYTRIIKAGYRAGDNASMAYIEFVDRNLDVTSVVDTTTDRQTDKSVETVSTAKKDDVEHEIKSGSISSSSDAGAEHTK